MHDAVEDQPEYASPQQIEDRFGARIAEIVAACTDADRGAGLSSSERKRLHLDHLRQLRDEGALRVLACAVRLLELGFFRIGGEEYAAGNDS